MSGLHRKFTIWRNRFRDAGLHPSRGRSGFMAEDPEEAYRSFICDETDRYLQYMGAILHADGSVTIGRNTFQIGGVPKIE